MIKNKVVQIRLSEELLEQSRTIIPNLSSFVRTAIRKELETSSDQSLSDTIIEPINPYSPFLYRATLLSVIDGDTLRLSIDLGFFTTTQIKIRLAEINTPPIDTPEGQKAMQFVKQELTGTNLLVSTRKKGKFGRYLAHVYYDKELTKPEDIIRRGKSINRELIKNALAEEY